ncbi:hypothetical protein DIPPA_21035 [Diplonema papillatum]|nr:hypothetical protein DIPPA_21035 [Diplonema papillatum]
MSDKLGNTQRALSPRASRPGNASFISTAGNSEPGSPRMAPRKRPSRATSLATSPPPSEIPDMLSDQGAEDLTLIRKEPRGLKGRDYNFLLYHHGGQANEIDTLIADFKGYAGGDGMNVNADLEVQRNNLQKKSVDTLIKILRVEMKIRQEAQDQCRPLSKELEETVDAHIKESSAVHDMAAALREKQLSLQLQTLELDQHNIVLKQEMQSKTRKLRDALETFKDHVEGLERGWDVYIDRRGAEKSLTEQARVQRLHEFDAYKNRMADTARSLKAEADKYLKLHEEQEKESLRLQKQLDKLTTRLGLEPEPMAKRRAAVSGVAQVIEPSERSTSSSSSSSSSGSSYSRSQTSTTGTWTTTGSSTWTTCSTCSTKTLSDHCSTCGATFSDVSSAGNVGRDASGISATFRAMTTGNLDGTRRSLHNTQKSSHHLQEQRKRQQQQQQQHRQHRQHQHQPKRGVLDLLHDIIKHDRLDLGGGAADDPSTPAKKGKRRNPSAARKQQQQPPAHQRFSPHAPRKGEDPERGFRFPFA